MLFSGLNGFAKSILDNDEADTVEPKGGTNLSSDTCHF